MAIYGAYVILATRTEGTRNILKINGGGAGAYVRRKAKDKREKGFQRKFIAAAKVERAACAYGLADCEIWFHLCMYSTDTLHPSP